MYEDVRLDTKNKTVHTKAHSLMYNLKDDYDGEELELMKHYRSNINLVGYSIFWKQLENGKNHMSLIENNALQSYMGWAKFYRTYFERRDAFNYLKSRWFAH